MELEEMVTITLGPDNTKLAIRPHGYNQSVNEMMQVVTGKRWVKNLGCWLAPFSAESLQSIQLLLGQVTEVRIDQKVHQSLAQQDKRMNSVVEIKAHPEETKLPEDFTCTTEPFAHQKTGINLGLRNKSFAFFCEMGCVTGDTLILHPNGAETRIEDLAGKKFKVCSFDGKDSLVSADAIAFLKGIDDIYRVELWDGKVISCTKDHVFLTTNGWKKLVDVRPEDAIVTLTNEYLASHLTTIEGSSQKAHAVNEHYSEQKSLNSEENYFVYSRLYGGRPLLSSKNDQASFPLQVGVLAQHRGMWQKDGQGGRQVGSRLDQSVFLPSMRDYGSQIDFFGRRFSLLRRNLERSVHGFHNTDQSLMRSIPIEEIVLPFQESFEMDYCISPFQTTRIKSIKAIGRQRYFDMHVPYYENYIGNGIVNHNTGKSKIILDILGYYLPKTRELSRPTLIVAPVSVVHNWQKQAQVHRPELRVVVLDGSSKDKENALLRQADVYVVNYESVWRIYESLCQIKWGFMVLDESTRIKNRATKQAKAILKLGKIASRRYILTGTPAPNSPLELFNQFRFLDPSVFGDSWYFYRDRYCVMGGYGGYQVLGFRNLEELSRKISGLSYRVLKSECLDLPDKIYKQFRLPMTEQQAKKYKELSDELVTEVAGTEIRTEVVMAKMTKLRQMASGFVYLGDGSSYKFESNKLEKLKEIMEMYAENHKIVVWASFKEEISIIEDLLKSLNIGYVTLGEQGGRHDRIQQFQNDSQIRVFLSNQRSGGIGIDLYAADYCVFFSNDYSPEVRLQAEDRLHRIGQKNHVTYIDLVSKGSIDSTILRMLSKKQDLSSQIMADRIRLKEIIHGDDTNDSAE